MLFYGWEDLDSGLKHLELVLFKFAVDVFF